MTTRGEMIQRLETLREAEQGVLREKIGRALAESFRNFAEMVGKKIDLKVSACVEQYRKDKGI